MKHLPFKMLYPTTGEPVNQEEVQRRVEFLGLIIDRLPALDASGVVASDPSGGAMRPYIWEQMFWKGYLMGMEEHTTKLS